MPNAPRKRLDVADLLAASALMLAAVVCVFALPTGSLVRAIIAGLAILLVPGYLLLQASIRESSPKQRAVHAAIALGVSPAVVGLLALATALVPGGFKAGPIIALVTFASLAFAGVAAWRRAPRRVSLAVTRPGDAKRVKAVEIDHD